MCPASPGSPAPRQPYQGLALYNCQGRCQRKIRDSAIQIIMSAQPIDRIKYLPLSCMGEVGKWAQLQWRQRFCPRSYVRIASFVCFVTRLEYFLLSEELLL